MSNTYLVIDKEDKPSKPSRTYINTDNIVYVKYLLETDSVTIVVTTGDKLKCKKCCLSYISEPDLMDVLPELDLLDDEDTYDLDAALD